MNKCKGCGQDSDQPICPDCSGLDNEQLMVNKFVKSGVSIPPLDVASWVYVDNKEHIFFLEYGIIIGKDHLHYRVKLKSYDEAVNGLFVWLPQHWVKLLPEELKNDNINNKGKE